jgi:hypothetical protein
MKQSQKQKQSSKSAKPRETMNRKTRKEKKMHAKSSQQTKLQASRLFCVAPRHALLVRQCASEEES